MHFVKTGESLSDLLFDWFGFNQSSEADVNSAEAKAAESKQNKQEVSRTMILPLKSVFSALSFEGYTCTCSNSFKRAHHLQLKLVVGARKLQFFFCSVLCTTEAATIKTTVKIRGKSDTEAS